MRKLGWAMAALCVAQLVISSAAVAEEKKEEIVELQDVVVTATKSEKGSADAPATVSVVKKNDIANQNVQSVDESLKFLPGVYANRPGGHEPSVMGTNALLRGIPDYSRTLVLVDGQTLNDPYIGAVTWESVPPETVERVEVVPGPFSSLYGGSAMGGVINIITKTPKKREIILKGGYGTDSFKSGTFLYQDRIFDRLGLILDYSYKQSEGYVKDNIVLSASSGAGAIPVSGWRQTTDSFGNVRYLVGDKGDQPWESWNAGLKLLLDLPDRLKISLGVSHFEYEKKWDHFHTYLRNSSGAPVSAGSVTFNDNGNKKITITESQFLGAPNPKIQDRYTLEFEKKLEGNRTVKATLGYMDIPMYDYIRPLSGATFDGGGPGSRVHRPNKEYSGTVQFSSPLFDRHFLVVGVSAGKKEIETFEYIIPDWRDQDGTGTTSNRTAGEDKYYAVFFQDEIALTSKLTAYIGGRYDYWRTEGFIEKVNSYKNVYDYRDQDHFSPKLSLVYRPFEKTTLRASAGKAFHPPVLRDTFGWWTSPAGKTYIPNPDLKPETVTSWEVGVEQQVGTGTLFRATYYENRLEDLIYRTETATTQSIANAAEALVRGVELEVRQRLMEGITAFVNFTYNDAKITENPVKPATEGKHMTATPQRMFNLGIDGQYGPWSGSVKGHYVGKVYANDENKDYVNGVYGSYDPYFIVDAKATYKFTENLSFSVSVDNLLDRDYYLNQHAQGIAAYGEVVFKF